MFSKFKVDEYTAELSASQERALMSYQQEVFNEVEMTEAETDFFLRMGELGFYSFPINRSTLGQC